MKLGGKHTASPNDWKSLRSLRLFKPPGLLPPFLSLFLPFLAVPFLHPFFSAAAASGRGFHTALMAREEERWSLPSNLTTVPQTLQQCCRLPALDWDYRHRGGTGLGEPAARGSPFISCNFQKLGSFGFFHQYAWKDDAQPTRTPTPPTLPGIRLTFFFLQQDRRPCKTAVQHRRSKAQPTGLSLATAKRLLGKVAGRAHNPRMKTR